MIDFDKEFHTDQILIRPLILEDLDEMFKLTLNPEMWTYFTSDLSNKKELKDWITSGINDNTRLTLTIIDKETNKIIGSTSIGNISLKDKRAEIGWTWISKSYQGKGINSKVKLILLKYLFNECHFERIESKTDVLNIPARKAMSKIGFVEEGVLRSHTLMINNRRRDTIFYSILNEEWNNIKLKNKL